MVRKLSLLLNLSLGWLQTCLFANMARYIKQLDYEGVILDGGREGQPESPIIHRN